MIQITINHDVKWIGWLAWVILYGIPILEKLNKLANDIYIYNLLLVLQRDNHHCRT